MSPILSICVPSRNRQTYFKDTIGFLLENARDDVEFVLADNSDDAADMNTFMAGISDARVKYLPAGEQVFSMKENWERCLVAATGDWVSVIGDDDLIDPDLVDALKIAMALKPGLEAFAWTNLNYDWATADKPAGNIKLTLESTFHDMPQPLIFRRAFRWDDAGVTLKSGFSVYHSAISRGLLERVKARFGGVYFEHPTIDYDNALKNAALGRNFVYCRRPFSIFGTCPQSNTAAAWNPKLFSETVARFKREFGRDYDADPWMKDFPFHAMLGMPYHSAISRGLLERVKARFGGVYFEHPTIDYDNALKNAALGRNFVYCRRPFSIFGTCPQSNTAAAWNPKLFSETVARFKREFGRDYDADPWMKDFPFHAMLGMPASIAQVQQFMRVTHGIGMAGWEPNFARSCAIYCSKFGAREDFDPVTDNLRAVFARWRGGAFLRHFEPVFTPKREGQVYTGLIGTDLYVEDRIGGARSPSEFYRAINGMLERPNGLAAELRTASKNSTVIATLRQVT